MSPLYPDYVKSNEIKLHRSGDDNEETEETDDSVEDYIPATPPVRKSSMKKQNKHYFGGAITHQNDSCEYWLFIKIKTFYNKN
jgi:hypothetical protein